MSTTENEIRPAKLFASWYHPLKKSSDIPIILIHGLFASSRTWNAVKRKISDSTKRTIVAYDLRNHGKSEFCDKNYLDIESDVCDLKNFMDSNNISKALIIAHSIGSRIAMAFSFKYPDMVEMLIFEDMSLTNSQNINDSFRTTSRAILTMSKLYKSFPSSCSEDQAQKKILKLARELIPELAEGANRSSFKIVAPLHKDFKTNKIVWDINLDICTAMEGRDSIYTIDLENNHVFYGDTLFITGEKSAFSLKHEKGLIERHFPNTHYTTFKQGYHAFHQEEPTLYLNTVVNFINARQGL